MEDYLENEEIMNEIEFEKQHKQKYTDFLRKNFHDTIKDELEGEGPFLIDPKCKKDEIKSSEAVFFKQPNEDGKSFAICINGYEGTYIYPDNPGDHREYIEGKYYQYHTKEKDRLLEKWSNSKYLSDIKDNHLKKELAALLENQELYNEKTHHKERNKSLEEKLFLNTAEIAKNLIINKISWMHTILRKADALFYCKETEDDIYVKSVDAIAQTSNFNEMLERKFFVKDTTSELNYLMLTTMANTAPYLNLVAPKMKIEEENIMSALSTLVDTIDKNTFRKPNWMVLNKKCYKKNIEKLEDEIKSKFNMVIHICEDYPSNDIIIGHKGDYKHECSHLYCPHIMLMPTKYLKNKTKVKTSYAFEALNNTTGRLYFA